MKSLPILASIALLCAAGCRPIDHSAAQTVDKNALAERQLEYAIYSLILRGNESSELLLIADSSIGFDGRIHLCNADDAAPYCIKPQPGTSPEAWVDYVRKNRQRVMIQPLFDKDLRLTLKRNAGPVDTTCTGPTTVWFSRVGFNVDRRQAVVAVTWVTGTGPFPGCGVITGSTTVFERHGSGWRSVGKGTISIT